MRNVSNIVEIKLSNLLKGKVNLRATNASAGSRGRALAASGQLAILLPQCLTINMCSYEMRVSMSNRFYRHTQLPPPISPTVLAVKIEMHAMWRCCCSCCCCRKAHYFRLEFTIKMNHCALAGGSEGYMCVCLIVVYKHVVAIMLIADAHKFTHTYMHKCIA